MPDQKKTFTMRMRKDNFDRISQIAKENKRSTTMQIEYLIENCIREYEEKNGRLRSLEDDA